MTRVIMWVYRAIYMVTLVVFGGMVFPMGVTWRAAVDAVYPLSFLALFSLVLLTGVTRRSYRWPVWAVTATCCIAYGSLGWLTGGNPFVLHELHTLDPDAMAVEERMNLIAGVPALVLSLLWFLTFPVIHELEFALNRLAGTRCSGNKIQSR